MTMEAIITICTALVTYLLGIINKKADLTDSKYIPLINLITGLLAGTACYAVGITDNIVNSIVICTVSALGAGGFYDLSKTKRDVDE